MACLIFRVKAAGSIIKEYLKKKTVGFLQNIKGEAVASVQNITFYRDVW